MHGVRILSLLLGLTLWPVVTDAATLRLDWSYAPGSQTVQKFRVERQANCTGPFAPVGEVTPVSATAATYLFRDTTAVVGQTYCWRVVALTATGKESAPSNVVQCLVPGVIAPPTQLHLTLE